VILLACQLPLLFQLELPLSLQFMLALERLAGGAVVFALGGQALRHLLGALPQTLCGREGRRRHLRRG
jgi:hypothetical protein